MNDAGLPGNAFAADQVRIGRCRVDLATGELFRSDARVQLGQRAVRLLRLLLDARGGLVTNEEIHRLAWQRTVVEHNTVQAHVSALRRALGEDRHLLETYAGRGYRLAIGPREETEAPSGAAVAAGQRPLPIATAPLIGRERLLEALSPLLDQHRFVTLTGAGGIGKTRLMVDAARLVAERFPGGVFVVDLAPITDPSVVHEVLVTSIGPPSSHRRSLVDRARSLGDEAVLIALDNCERLVDVIASAIDVLLSSNAAIHVLATSREPVRAAGEVIFKVPPLEVPPREDLPHAQLVQFSSIRLFLSRLPALQARFVTEAAVARAVSRICRRLDGIPLAIELAAGRADSLGVDTVAARLDDSLDLIRGGARTAPQRHQTLRATLEWSYDLLAAPQRGLFGRLAVFAGGFTIDAACQVLADDESGNEDIVGHIADLVDKSLLSIDAGAGSEVGVTRYRFLETTRSFALEKLSASGERDRLSRRHATHRLDVLRRIGAQTDPRSFRANVVTFRAEIENIRACLSWSYSPSGDVALGFALASRAVPIMLDAVMIEEAVRTAARAIASTPEDLIDDRVDDLRIRAARIFGGVYMTGATEEATRDWLDVLERARRLANDEFEIRAYWGLWTVAFFAGRPTEALGFADQFATFAEQVGNTACVVLGDRTRGVALHYLGDQRGARRHLERMIGRYVHTAHPMNGAGVMNHATVARATLARVLWFQGSPDHAGDSARAAVAEAVAQDHPTTICFVLVECALPISLLSGDTDGARAYLDLLLATIQRQAFVVFEIVGRCYAALLADDATSRLAVVAELRSTIDELQAMRFEMYSTELRLQLARVLGEADRVDEALVVIDEATSASVARDEGLWQSELTRMRVEFVLRSEAPDELVGAEEDLRRALDRARGQGAVSLEQRIGTTLLRLLEGLGKPLVAAPDINRIRRVKAVRRPGESSGAGADVDRDGSRLQVRGGDDTDRRPDGQQPRRQPRRTV